MYDQNNKDDLMKGEVLIQYNQKENEDDTI